MQQQNHPELSCTALQITCNLELKTKLIVLKKKNLCMNNQLNQYASFIQLKSVYNVVIIFIETNYDKVESLTESDQTRPAAAGD